MELKEILQNLNETAVSYLNENSIEKQFNQYAENIIEKLDSVSNDLETTLSNKLKSKYSKYNVNNLMSQNVSHSAIHALYPIIRN